MHEQHLQERLATLESIAATANRALAAIADRDLDQLRTIDEERGRLFQTLRNVDARIARCDGPVGDSAAGRALRARTDELLRGLVPTEETVRVALGRWRDETGDELRGMRRSQHARSAYAAAGAER